MRSQDLNLDPRPNTEIIHRDARMHSHVHVPIYLYVTYINKIRLVPFERTEHQGRSGERMITSGRKGEKQEKLRKSQS